jgi:uncharacterized protein
MGYHLFGLTLMVTHACNMRCHYCYTGDKAARRMPAHVGDTAIRRAIASVVPGGQLDLSFFGGEPLLEAPAIRRWMDAARLAARDAGITVAFHLTTNGTVETAAAWEVLKEPDLRVAVSVDGLPAIHDRFRVFADGRGTSAAVQHTLTRLLAAGKSFSVVMVVRPDTVADLAGGIRHLRALGVRRIEPSLDLWTRWTREDAAALRRAIAAAADLWHADLPEHSLTWFDEKVGALSHPAAPCARCGFGDGELAVAPSGNLYPCERLIGEDAPANPMRLPGHACDDLPDFAPRPSPAGRDAPACTACALREQCNTVCRCSNFVRTGDVRRPDGLLCMLNQACLEDVAARLCPVPPAHSAATPPAAMARSIQLSVVEVPHVTAS